ncbi:hypothetical protein GIB67_037204 [Kingdonia uniflora]|uniref:DAGKc domain-containing protein n=1 Tax=Kingdonia uniflora TaxID=39325 RepID=A0A7J7MRU0_9MAGN|nr:hypothetical protein GIB67_037204 [Kingdonia uniflora]
MITGKKIFLTMITGKKILLMPMVRELSAVKVPSHQIPSYLIALELMSWKTVSEITDDKKVLKKILKERDGYQHPNKRIAVKVILIGKLQDGQYFLRRICESLTSGPSHAIDITREAIREGADAVVAVGGDGTLHEVVNGFFWEGKPVSAHNQGGGHTTALGLIPLGTGSDFARTFGWNSDPQEAVERIARGSYNSPLSSCFVYKGQDQVSPGLKSRVDVGVISGETEEPHYFVNVADIHLSAKAGYYASAYKRFGNLCYVLGALKGFVGHTNQDLRIKINGGNWEVLPQVTALCVGNAKFFGGGMKITPNSDPHNGSFEVVVLQDFKWYDFILKVNKLYSGTHLSVKNVFSRSEVQSIEVEEIGGNGSIYVQSDGEHLGFLPRKFCILPAAIEMLY